MSRSERHACRADDAAKQPHGEHSRARATVKATSSISLTTARCNGRLEGPSPWPEEPPGAIKAPLELSAAARRCPEPC
jgi:hypothetical protein